jgi:hypothetical protein
MGPVDTTGIPEALLPHSAQMTGYQFEQEEARQPGFVPIPSHKRMKLKVADSRDTKTFKYQDLLFQAILEGRTPSNAHYDGFAQL